MKNKNNNIATLGAFIYTSLVFIIAHVIGEMTYAIGEPNEIVSFVTLAFLIRLIITDQLKD